MIETHRTFARLFLKAALCCVCLAVAGCALDSEPSAPARDKAEGDALIEGLKRGGSEQADALQTWLGENSDAPTAQRRAMFSALCDARGRERRYGDAAEACESAMELDPSPGAGIKGAVNFWRSLAEVAPTQASGSVNVPIATDWSGLVRVEGRVADQTVEWVIDTGAEVSVMSESTARRTSVRYLETSVEVGSSTAVPANGSLGIVDELHIGNAVVGPVVVFVLPDRALTMAPGKTIPAILGLPVFLAFERMAWLDNGKRLALGGPAVESAHSAPITWHAQGFSIQIGMGGKILDAHLDTGANRTELGAPAYDALTEAEKAAGKAVNETSGGVGGLETKSVTRLPSVTLRIADQPVTLKNIGVDRARAEDAGRLGWDVLAGFKSAAVDFQTMTISVTPR